MSGVSLKVVETAGEMLTAMLKMYHEKLDKAYLRSEGSLTVDLKTTFKPADNGQMEVDVSINFVTDRIKNKFTRTIDENQEGLFKKEEGEVVDAEFVALTPAKEALAETNG
jgi:hypothetical protein